MGFRLNDGQIDRRTDGLTEGQMDGGTEGRLGEIKIWFKEPLSELQILIFLKCSCGQIVLTFNTISRKGLAE